MTPREALRRLGLNLTDVGAEDLAHNRWLTSGIWRVSIEGRPMIVKCLARDRSGTETAWDAHWSTGVDEPRRWNYWAREGLAYRDRLVEIFEPRIVAPTLLAADYAADSIVLLLELVNGRPGEEWAVADYAVAARALGRGQGRQLSASTAPEHPWLSRGFLRQYSNAKPVDWRLLDDDAAWAQPLVQRNFPPELREAATWMHATRDRLYTIAEALPRVTCHLDYWTKNLIMRPDGRVALLDWAFVGDGSVGEDIGNLIPDAAFDHFLSADVLPALEVSVLEAYTEGLAEGGWNGDPRLVELGVAASAIKYDWLTPAMLAAASAATHLRYGGTETIDADYRYRERGLALLDNTRRARRAVALANELHL